MQRRTTQKNPITELLATLVLPAALLLSFAASPRAHAANDNNESAAHPDFSGVWMAIGVENPDGGSAATAAANGQRK